MFEVLIGKLSFAIIILGYLKSSYLGMLNVAISVSNVAVITLRYLLLQLCSGFATSVNLNTWMILFENIAVKLVNIVGDFNRYIRSYDD